jgi:ankyrin repeat protein
VKSDGQTPLHEAAEAGQKEAVLYLLSSGANAQAQDEVGFHLFLCCAMN